MLARIRKAVTNRVLTELKTRAKDAEKYEKFWENFGPVLKEGVWEDAEHRKRARAAAALPLLGRRGLDLAADYVARMKHGAGRDLLS